MQELKINKLYKYDPNNSPDGLEVRFKLLESGILKIWIPGTNSKHDWKQNIFGAFKPVKINNKKIHKNWYRWAKEFSNYLMTFEGLEKIKSMKIGGHSMGAAVCCILKDYFFAGYKIQYRFYAMPKPYLKNNKAKIISNKWDLVPLNPPWYEKHKNVEYTKRKRSLNIYKNHMDYDFKGWKF